MYNQPCGAGSCTPARRRRRAGRGLCGAWARGSPCSSARGACRPRRRRPGTCAARARPGARRPPSPPPPAAAPARRRRPPARSGVDARPFIGAGVPSPPATWMRAGLLAIISTTPLDPRGRRGPRARPRSNPGSRSRFPRSSPFRRRRRRRSPSRRVSSRASRRRRRASPRQYSETPSRRGRRARTAIIGTAGAPPSRRASGRPPTACPAPRARASTGRRRSARRSFVRRRSRFRGRDRLLQIQPAAPRAALAGNTQTQRREGRHRARVDELRGVLRILSIAVVLLEAAPLDRRARSARRRLSVAPPRAMAWRRASYTASQSSASAANAASASQGPASSLSSSARASNKCAKPRRSSGGRSALLASLARSSRSSAAPRRLNGVDQCGGARDAGGEAPSPPLVRGCFLRQATEGASLLARIRLSVQASHRTRAAALIAVQCCLHFCLWQQCSAKYVEA